MRDRQTNSKKTRDNDEDGDKRHRPTQHTGTKTKGSHTQTHRHTHLLTHRHTCSTLRPAEGRDEMNDKDNFKPRQEKASQGKKGKTR